MAKSKKPKTKQLAPQRQTTDTLRDHASTGSMASLFSQPTKKPSLLAISVVLFSLWFVYLLVVALGV
jgi:hypothetical protein